MRWVLMSLILVVGCEAPLPGAVPLANADGAALALLEHWREDTTRALPVFWGVPADPSCEIAVPGGTTVGFRNPEHDTCTGGFTSPEHGIFLLLHPRVGYSRHFAHELQHWLRGDEDHRRRGVWEPPLGESDTNLVPSANTWLRAQPELDTMLAL